MPTDRLIAAVLLLACALPGFAADPVITDEDIARAQQQYRMPSDEELARIPIPSTPNVDALETPPGGTVPVDPAAIAERFMANGAPRQTTDRPALFVFVSLAMPHVSLKQISEQAARSGAVLMLRGLKARSLKATALAVREVMGDRPAAWQIDPEAFRRFGVKVAPTVVLVKAGAQAESCGEAQCVAPASFAAVAGDVSLDYALAEIERMAPAFAAEARGFRERGKR